MVVVPTYRTLRLSTTLLPKIALNFHIAPTLLPNMANWYTSVDKDLANQVTVEDFLALEEAIPWHQLPHESIKAWRAFCAYRDLGRKRAVSLVRGSGIKVSNQWMIKFKWTSRVSLYDEYVFAEEQVEQHKLNREIRIRHAEQAAKALDGLMAPFIEFQRRSDEEPDILADSMRNMDTKKLISTMQASARVLQPLMSIERLTQDLPTERVETHVQGQITIQDNPEALINVLEVLATTGVGHALFGENPIIDLIDTAHEPVDTDNATPETASLPASTSP